MANAGNALETDFLELLFQNADITNIGDATGLQGSSTAGTFYVRLCTDDSVCSDSAVGTEASYTGYITGGVAVARSAAGWDIPSAGGSVENAAVITFGECTDSATETIRYVEVWKNNSDTTDAYRIAWIQLGTDKDVSDGDIPKFAAGELTFTFN